MGFDLIQDGKLLGNFKSLVVIIINHYPQMNIMDETEITAVPMKVPEVIKIMEKRLVGRLCPLVTIACAVSASSTHVAPAIIFHRK
jgi:hypothetical protein